MLLDPDSHNTALNISNDSSKILEDGTVIKLWEKFYQPTYA